jgi:Phycobilisome protein
MLSQMQRLSLEVEGRYATDGELKFIPEYLKTYELRLQTYQKLQEIEATVLQQVHEKIQAQDPTLFRNGNVDLAAKCKRDALTTWRYTAITLLMDDQETLRDRYLLWYQSIMRSYNLHRQCSIAYGVMQEVVKPHLTAQQNALIMPILDLNRRMLSV